FFFFSSRRRHTRSKRDWSSDVCSSDLSPSGVISGDTVTCSALAATFAVSKVAARALQVTVSPLITPLGEQLTDAGVVRSYALFEDRKSGVQGRRVGRGGCRTSEYDKDS